VSSKGKHEDENQGIGLYTGEQEQYTTPFQYFAQIVVGAVVFLYGVFVLILIFDQRSREAIKFGRPEPHLYDFGVAGAIIVVGILMAHAGAIFWGRRVSMHRKKRRERHVARGH
jgi:hypothetical protein